MRLLAIPALLFSLAHAAPAAIIDRIAAVVDRQVITESELEQIALLGIVDRQRGESGEPYRRRVLDAMIAQALRYRDVVRFGAEDVARDAIEARKRELIARFGSEGAFRTALARTELTDEELDAIIKRQLQVEAYIDERFAPLIFVSLDEIERYYREVWLPQRRERGLPATPLSDVSEEIRTLLKAERLQEEIDRWTDQLRSRANVDVHIYR